MESEGLVYKVMLLNYSVHVSSHTDMHCLENQHSLGKNCIVLKATN